MRIEETTVATIDGWMITVSNVLRGPYTTPEGARTGMTALVGRYDAAEKDHGEVTVGEGSRVEIAGKPWTVLAVTAGQGGDNGWIELRRDP